MARVLLNLGSNIRRHYHLCAGLDALRERFGALSLSRVFESEAIGFRGDPFYNLAVSLHSDLSPGALAADQNDCIDETSNTTTLLLMLKDRGALAHHDVGPPAKRGVFVDIALPHRSATVVERASGGHYVLDSWFRASGVAADVAPLDQWLKGWTPEGGAWS